MDKFVDGAKAAELVGAAGAEFAVVRNPDYVHPPFEIYPLAAKITTPRERIRAIVTDMDGTTTTTEALCLHSLEFMVRRISGRMSRAKWAGLDRAADYPHIIGNSTTKHVEYLIEKYQAEIKPQEMTRAFVHSALWFLAFGKDEGRVREVRNNLVNLGCGAMLDDPRLKGLLEKKRVNEKEVSDIASTFVKSHGRKFHADTFTLTVRAAIDIYYQRYHEILAAIQRGQGEKLSEELLGAAGRHLVEPLAGVGVFLALVKGWLGESVRKLVPDLMTSFRVSCPEECAELDIGAATEKLVRVGKKFESEPARIGIVTSSIFYEANIVMTAVFDLLRKQVEAWPVAKEKKDILREKFSAYQNVYDGVVTATDSSEIRLKPHRDLYSIALHQLGVAPGRFDEVIGFEDSESGTIAIRAAGIGLCVAVPFPESMGHDLRAASFVLRGGLPEALLRYNLFVK
ncbi:MAG: hypothetical protein V2A74_06060 [bacterium]